MLQLSGERGLRQEELAVHPAALGIVEGLGERDLDRDVAPAEGVVAEIDLGGRAFAELAQHRVLADLLEHAAVHLLPQPLSRARDRLSYLPRRGAAAGVARRHPP